MKTDPIPGRMYRHYKGGLYVVEAIAEHTEREERLVIYRHTSGSVHARPVDEWNRPINNPLKLRFELVGREVV